jgi:hypothetical protein
MMERMRNIDDTYISLFKDIDACTPFSVLPKAAVQQACRDSYVRKNSPRSISSGSLILLSALKQGTNGIHQETATAKRQCCRELTR